MPLGRQQKHLDIDFVRDSDKIDEAMRRAVNHALLEHKRAGNPIAVWEDGRVVIIPSEEIQVMPALTDIQHHNRLVLTISQAIEATFSDSDWKKLAYVTDTVDWVMKHERLLRSLQWGDPDYGGHILDAVEVALARDPANLHKLMSFTTINEWIKDNNPTIYAEFFGSDPASIAIISDAEDASSEFTVDDYIRRIRAALPDDPALAIGSTKELIESVLKTILGLHGARIGDDDMPKLLKKAQVALQLDPKDVDPSAAGGESLKRLLGSLGLIVVCVNELRNLYGTGHGKSNAPGLDTASTNLAVNGGIAVAVYLMDRYKAVKEP